MVLCSAPLRYHKGTYARNERKEDAKRRVLAHRYKGRQEANDQAVLNRQWRFRYLDQYSEYSTNS